MTEYQYDIARFLSRQLAQATPADTPAASLYTPGDGVEAIVKRIIICNTSGSNAAFDIFHDDDGTTYNTTTQLYFNQTLTAGLTRVLDDEIYVDSAGSIGAASDTTAALTFSVYGDEAQVRAR